LVTNKGEEVGLSGTVQGTGEKKNARGRRKTEACTILKGGETFLRLEAVSGEGKERILIGGKEKRGGGGW